MNNDKINTLVEEIANLSFDEIWELTKSLWNKHPVSANILTSDLDLQKTHEYS